MKKDIVIFDFCDTLFSGQSVSHFITFLIQKESFFKKWYLKFRRRLNRIPSTDSKRHKEFLFKPFSGYSLDYFEKVSSEFYEQVIKKGLNARIIGKLIESKEKGDFIVIISGGFDVYLKYFVEEYNLDELISTKLKFTDNKFSGEILGKESLGSQKLVMYNQMLEELGVKFGETTCYTDHHTDLPLLEIADKGYVIDFGQDLSWVKDKWETIKL